MITIKPLNWSPYFCNPIDYIRGNKNDCTDLFTYDGVPVSISFFTSFTVTIGSKKIETGDNLSTCYLLNQYQVGVK